MLRFGMVSVLKKSDYHSDIGNNFLNLNGMRRLDPKCSNIENYGTND